MLAVCSVYGLHLNMMVSGLNSAKRLFLSLVGSYVPSLVFSEPEHSAFSLASIVMRAIKESGYMHLQATRPDTVS